ncbi:hypothetical protein [Nosocomiicoccus sp. HMSC059G07]|uniref:hypothetical protein n=1 Tax=Nosocomiicoccus sp. HMSC059G07 TaxID=1739531 RepID=UPI0008A242B3|nr:hypothetical protein [Nosocomiicoccus sp. HMSC059G07]OFO55296.1 hypothetical protein HMPREF3029_04565 [Nosocomiicoccus sp. HMSC059G07]
MKDIFIDLKNTYKNNIGKFYVGLIFLIIFSYMCLIILNTFKPEEAIRQTMDSGERISFEGEELTYIESIYNPNENELEILFGINSVGSLFSDKNLKAKAVIQKDRTKNKEVTVKKVNPQIISMKIKDVPSNYLLARLTTSFKKVGSDSSKENVSYISHESISDKKFSEKDYLEYAISFKSSFVESEIENLNQKLIQLDEEIKSKEENISELKSSDSLLTEQEKNKVDTQIETFTKQIDLIEDQKKKIKNEIQERERQLDEYKGGNS